MRTTLSIDDDVLEAAKGLADQHGKTVGQVISELSRKSLGSSTRPRKMRNGVALLTVRSPTPITLELVNRMRDELP